MDEEIYSGGENRTGTGIDDEIYPGSRQEIFIKVNEPNEIVPDRSPDIIPAAQPDAVKQSGFPIGTLCLSAIEIISALLFMIFNENVWFYDLQMQAFQFFASVTLINIAAWAVILKKKLFTADRFILSWEFPVSVIVPYLTVLLISGNAPSKQYGEAADMLRLFGYEPEHVFRILFGLLGIHRGFAGFFDFHWYMYLIVLAFTIFLIGNRKRGTAETAVLTAINPAFLFLLFRIIFNTAYEIAGYTSF